jgi:hypothetical protein
MHFELFKVRKVMMEIFLYQHLEEFQDLFKYG